MILKVWYNLLSKRKELSADSKFKKELWCDLSSRWQQVYHTDLNWYQTFSFRMAVSGLIVIIVLGGFGTGAYAYTSSEVTSDNILYPVKKSLENIEGLTKITPQAKAKFYLKTIEKREKEKKILEKRKQAVVQIVIENTEKQIEQIEEKLIKINKDISKDDKVKTKVEKQIEKRQERLQEKIKKIEEREKNKGRNNVFDQSSEEKKSDEKRD